MPSLFRMIAEMGLNIRPFQAGLQQSEKLAEKTAGVLADKFKGLAASYFGYRALDALIGKTIDRAREIHHLADQFQITSDEVQNLGRAAGKVGLEFDDFGTALSKLGSARKEAVESSLDLRESFARYGITLRQLNDPQVRNIDLIKTMASAMGDLGDMSQKDRQIFRDLFGRSGDRLIVAMSQFSEDKNKIISKENIDDIYEAEKAMKLLRKQWEIFASKPIGGGAKMLSEQLGILNDPKVSPWMKALTLVTGPLPNLSKPGPTIAGAGEAQNFPAADFFDRQRGQKLYEDKIAEKEKLAAAHSAMELEKKVSEFLFGRLTHEKQLVFLRQKQADLGREIQRQQEQQTDDNYSKAIQEQNITDLKNQQLDIAEKIRNVEDKRRVDIGAIAQVRGAAAAISASIGPQGSQVFVDGQQLNTQQQILSFLKANAGKAGRITFAP